MTYHLRTIDDILAETDIIEIGAWPNGDYYEDDERAKVPELGSPPLRPESYFAPTTAFGTLMSRGSTDAKDLGRNPRQASEDQLLAKYLRSRWTQRRGSHR